MGFNKLIFALRVISCLSFTILMILIFFKHKGTILYSFKSIKKLSVNLNQAQIQRFEKRTRYIYRTNKGWFYKLNIKLAQAGMMGWLNAASIIIFSVLLLIISYLVACRFVYNPLISFYISILFAILPYSVISLITQINLTSIEKYMLYNMETLLNFISIDKGNIRNAYRSAYKYFKPNIFKKHTEIFVFQIMQRSFSEAVNSYINIVNIRVYGDFLNAVSACERIGGDYEKLTSHFTERLAVLQKAKIMRISRSTSVRLAIYFLILANIGFFFFLRYMSKSGYYLVTSNPIIMSFVFISMYIVLYLGNKAGKLKI